MKRAPDRFLTSRQATEVDMRSHQLFRRSTVVLALPVVLLAGCQRQSPNLNGAATANPATLAANAQPATAVLPSTPAPFASPPLLTGTPDVAALVARVKPSVVNITTVQDVRPAKLEDGIPFGPFGMQPFPFGQGRRGGDNPVLKKKALGSGFLVDGKGHVVTNAHVVEGANEVKVKLADEREFSAKVIGRDQRLDLAVLELADAKDTQGASLGSSTDLRVGEYVVAIGNPFGLGNTVTMGIVSAKDRAIGAGPYDDFIQTDASINPGNSGGPLFNLKGEVVGINTAINPNGQGIGFAIPVDALKDVIDPLITKGRVARGYLGVLIQPVDAALGKALGLQGAKGALVAEVVPGGAAERAGVKSGDVIVAVDGTQVPSSEDLPRIVARHAPGARAKVDVLRAGNRLSLDIGLDELKDETARADQKPSTQPGASAPAGLGIEIGESPNRKGEVVIGNVTPGSPADGQLMPGDIILEVNQGAVHRPEDVVARAKNTPNGSPVLFKIKREGKPRYVAIERTTS
jgi:serine protease Do